MEMQRWFGGVISAPLTERGKIQPITASRAPIEQEASLFIEPNKDLTSAQRIEIYNQQYWYRLLAVLQETFSQLSRLFGYDDFNTEIAIPYLTASPPSSWTLHALGDTLYSWLDKTYSEADKDRVLSACEIDWAFHTSFLSPAHTPITGTPEETFTRQLQLAPHVHLIDHPFDMIGLRDIFLTQSIEYWCDNDFPKLDHTHTTCVIYRKPNNDVTWDRVEPPVVKLLKEFEHGTTIEALLEHEPNESIGSWLQEWIIKGWLHG